MAYAVHCINDKLLETNYYYALSTASVHNPTQISSSHTGIADTGASGFYFVPGAHVSNINTRAPTIQLVPPDMHRRNRAERAIRTFKNNFISILAGVDPSFPPYLWDLLLPQAELTLNLLRQSSLNPKISAWEYFNGPFDFNKTPLGPVGCRVLIHAKPATRRSWDFRAKEGFYIGPALDSYRCFKLVKMDTKSQVISDTVEFRHAYRQIPIPTPEDRIVQRLQAVTDALRDTPPPTTISQLEALTNLRDIFNSWRLLAPPPPGLHRGPTP